MKKLIFIQLIIFAAALFHFSVFSADWPTFRGNPARTGFYPDPIGYPKGDPVWKLSLNCQIVSSPAVVSNVLYIGARDSCIYAVSCENGRVLWKTKTGGWVDGSPLVTGNRIIIGSRDSSIYVIDKNSGAIVDRLSAGVQLSTPVLTTSGMILCGHGVPGGGVRAYMPSRTFFFDTKTGPKWSVPLPQFTYSSPAIRGQAAVIGATDGKLYGIDVSVPDTIWSMQTGGLIYLSTPAIDNTTVFLAPGDEDRNVYAINLLDGSVIWRYKPVSPESDTLSALPKRGTVQLLSSADCANLLLVSPPVRARLIRQLRENGIELPRVRITGGLAKSAAGASAVFVPLDGMKTSSVAVGPKNVYIIQKKLGYLLRNDSLTEYKQRFSIFALDKNTGAQAWSFTDWCGSPQLGYCSSPVVTNTMVYFGWGDGRIYGLDAENGRKLWEDTLQGHVISSPAMAAGKLFMATYSGNLYAYNLANTPPATDFRQSTYCYPNPVRADKSNIQTYVEKAGRLSITIYTMAERPVVHFERDLAAGEKYTYAWALGNAANGVYFARVKIAYKQGGDDQKTLKIAVVR